MNHCCYFHGRLLTTHIRLPIEGLIEKKMTRELFCTKILFPQLSRFTPSLIELVSYYGQVCISNRRAPFSLFNSIISISRFPVFLCFPPSLHISTLSLFLDYIIHFTFFSSLRYHLFRFTLSPITNIAVLDWYFHVACWNSHY